VVETQPLPADLHAEVRLWLEWARGAGGPWLLAEGPGPAFEGLAPAAAPGSGAAPEGAPGSRGGARPGARTSQAAVEAPPAPAPESRAERAEALAALAAEVQACTRCVLAGSRAHAVFGEGSPKPKLVVVGEAPGADEDRTGRPFVGRAGQLLTRMLAAIGLPREEVFICNLLKCRPPDNRNPRPDEVVACKSFLREQLRLLDPPLILALGSPAARELLQTRRGIMSLRGRFMRTPDGYRVMPSFHPAYLLRNPAAKRDAWADLQQVARALELELPPRQ